MLILLPPSESKSVRARGRAVDPASWSFPELSSTRASVAQQLREVSQSPNATTDLGVSTHLALEVSRNLILDSTPAAPTAEVYTGVLYDALDLAAMDAATRRRANRWIVIISALYGAVRPTDKIAAYRLSMGVNLPSLGPLAAVWRPVLDEVLTRAAGREVIIDCRSSTYAVAWTPSGDVTKRWVQIRVPGATHMAKHTRGLVARHVCESGVRTASPVRLETIVAQRFHTQLHEPSRPGRPWVLEVQTRG